MSFFIDPPGLETQQKSFPFQHILRVLFLYFSMQLCQNY